MSRKDTIIIASIINVVLLVVLFLTGVKREPRRASSQEPSVQTVQPIALPPIAQQEIKAAQGDEIDRVLREFSQKTHGSQDEKKEEVKVNFAKELEAITKTPQPKKEKSSERVVTVKKGDALEKIARTHQTSVKEIMELNNLRSTTLQIGQVLKLPSKKSENRPMDSFRDAQFYTVKSGDSPWTIAVKNHLKLEELLELNHLDEEKARHLKPGDQIRIR